MLDVEEMWGASLTLNQDELGLISSLKVVPDEGDIEEEEELTASQVLRSRGVQLVQARSDKFLFCHKRSCLEIHHVEVNC